MAVSETPMSEGMLLFQKMPARSPIVSNRRYGASQAAEGFDRCLHLASWTGQASLPTIRIPSAQI